VTKLKSPMLLGGGWYFISLINWSNLKLSNWKFIGYQYMGTMHANGTQGLLQQRHCLAWSTRGTLLELILAAWTGSEVRNKSRKTWTYHQSKELSKYFTLKTKWKKITILACSRTKHYFRHQTAQLLTNSYFTKKMSNTGLVEKKPQQQQSPKFLLTLALRTVYTLK
jgi:hypothetical protein